MRGGKIPDAFKNEAIHRKVNNGSKDTNEKGKKNLAKD